MALSVDIALVMLGGEVSGEREARLALHDLGRVRGGGDAVPHLREDCGEKGVMRVVGPGNPREGQGRKINSQSPGRQAGMKKTRYIAPPPPEQPKTIIAALGPHMLVLAAEQADGAHPYNVTPEHTAEPRKILGPGKLLCPEQMVLGETDPAKARATARATLAVYMSLPNYSKNWQRLGFTDADFADGGSDRRVDAIVAWGDDEAIRARLQAHWDAGADHVCIQALGGVGTPIPKPDEELLKRFAPGA